MKTDAEEITSATAAAKQTENRRGKKREWLTDREEKKKEIKKNADGRLRYI